MDHNPEARIAMAVTPNDVPNCDVMILDCPGKYPLKHNLFLIPLILLDFSDVELYEATIEQELLMNISSEVT